MSLRCGRIVVVAPSKWSRTWLRPAAPSQVSRDGVRPLVAVFPRVMGNVHSLSPRAGSVAAAAPPTEATTFWIKHGNTVSIRAVRTPDSPLRRVE